MMYRKLILIFSCLIVSLSSIASEKKPRGAIAPYEETIDRRAIKILCKESHCFVGDGENPFGASYYENEWATSVWRIHHKTVGTIVCCIKKIPAWRTKHDQPAWALITALVVAKEYQRKGIGSALLQEMLGSLREKNVANVEAYVSSYNPAAQQFFEKHGFTQNPATAPGFVTYECTLTNVPVAKPKKKGSHSCILL